MHKTLLSCTVIFRFFFILIFLFTFRFAVSQNHNTIKVYVKNNGDIPVWVATARNKINRFTGTNNLLVSGWKKVGPKDTRTLIYHASGTNISGWVLGFAIRDKQGRLGMVSYWPTKSDHKDIQTGSTMTLPVKKENFEYDFDYNSPADAPKKGSQWIDGIFSWYVAEEWAVDTNFSKGIILNPKPTDEISVYLEPIKELSQTSMFDKYKNMTTKIPEYVNPYYSKFFLNIPKRKKTNVVVGCFGYSGSYLYITTIAEVVERELNTVKGNRYKIKIKENLYQNENADSFWIHENNMTSITAQWIKDNYLKKNLNRFATLEVCENPPSSWNPKPKYQIVKLGLIGF